MVGRLTSASFRDDGDGDRTTHSTLSFLDTQVCQKDLQNVLRAQAFGDVTEGIHSGSADTLFVSLQEVQKFKTDTHPFTRRHELSASISCTENVSK